MKVSEWHDLCEREHAKGGEVIAVALTSRGMKEMAEDLMRDPAAVSYFYDKDRNLVEAAPGDRISAGGRLGQLFNMAEGGREVDFTPLADADTVTVRDADGQTRVVSLASA